MSKRDARVKAPVLTGGPSGAAIYQTRSQTLAMRPNINLLPDEMLAIILSKLDLKSQVKCESVCTLWRQIVKEIFATKRTLIINESECDSFLKEPINRNDCVFPYDFVSASAPEKVIRKTIAQIVAKYRGIRSLVGIFRGFDANLINTLCNRCDADIHSLHIIFSDLTLLWITRSEIQIVVKKYPNLEEFYIEANDEIMITESAVGLLLKGLPALKRFTLKALQNQQQYSGQVFENMSAGIQSISTSNALFNATAISRLGAKRPDQLRELNLNHFNPDCMPLIAHNLQTLEKLSINFSYSNYCHSVDLKLVLASISRLVHLQELSITANFKCKVIDGLDIARLRECPNIHTLRMQSVRMTDNCVKAMVDNIPALRHLTLSYVPFGSVNLLSCLAPICGARHLRSLCLQEYELTDDLIDWLVTKCPQISFIDVMFGIHLTTDAMMSCVRVCRQQPNRELRVVFWGYLEEDFVALNEQIPQNLVFEYKF